MTRPQQPQFRGVRTYRDPQGRFSFRHPSDWNRFELDENRDGIMVSFQPGAPTTYFAVWVTPLQTKVVAEDHDVLREGVDAGLAQLPECEISYTDDKVLSNLVKFERTYTFRDGEFTRQRRTWVLYVDTWQYVLVWQGATPPEYEYWLPMGNYAFAMFELPQALWFATDRDLASRRG